MTHKGSQHEGSRSRAVLSTEADGRAVSVGVELFSQVTDDGIVIDPVYTDTSDSWGHRSRLVASPIQSHKAGRGRHPCWQIRQVYSGHDLLAINRLIVADIATGVDAVCLDTAKPVPVHGIAAHSLANLSVLFEGVDLRQVAVYLNGGQNFVASAAMLAELWQQKGIKPEESMGGFQGDPLGALAAMGSLPASVDRMLVDLGELALWSHQTYSAVTSALVDTAVYSGAGATDAQEIAFAIATGLTYVRAMEEAGLSLESAFSELEFSVRTDATFLSSVGKLRVLRMLWERIGRGCGVVAADFTTRLHVRPSYRVLTAHSPWSNQLRNTVCCFAGAIGGADAITTEPWDVLISSPNQTSQRLATHTQLILAQECMLGRVHDPCAGSYMLEAFTDELAAHAWNIFQKIEEVGGMGEALVGGEVHELVGIGREKREGRVAHRTHAITGVSAYPAFEEVQVSELVSSPSVVATGDRSTICAMQPRDVAELMSVGRQELMGHAIETITSALYEEAEPVAVVQLVARRDAEPYELLRAKSDDVFTEQGVRPKVCLVRQGAPDLPEGLKVFATQLLAAGGLMGIDVFGQSTADIVETYEHVSTSVVVVFILENDDVDSCAELVAALKQVGAKWVVGLAPSELQMNESLDSLLFPGCDALRALQLMWHCVESAS